MKISKNKYLKKDLRKFFLSFLLSLVAISAMSALVFVYLFAEEKGMGITLPKLSKPLLFPYEILEFKFYLI